jgi:hypothetical protein
MQPELPLAQTPEEIARQDRRARQVAYDKLAAKLVQLGALAGLTVGQVNVASRERAIGAHREPATNAERLEAFELASQLEGALPELSGTALCTAVQLLIFLLDPAGQARLRGHLRQARALVAEWVKAW